MSIIIRQATFDDIDNIKPMWIKLVEFHSDKQFIFKSSPDFRDKVVDDIKLFMGKPNVAFFVVEQDKKLVGFSSATISQRPSVFAIKSKGYIGDTYVDEELRGQGIGTNLISTTIDWLKKQGAQFVDLQVMSSNETGRKFWEKSGFQTVNYYMVKNLTNE